MNKDRRTARHLVSVALVTVALLTACHSAVFTRSESRVRDDTLAREVKNRFLEARQLDLSRIDVSAENGVIYLSGESGNSESKFVAEQLALGITGVKRVVNKLEVQP